VDWLLNLLNQSGSHGQLDRQITSDVRQLRRHLNWGKETDSRQDKQIRQLQMETAELKLFVSALLQLLVRKGTATKEDLAKVADLVRREMGKAEAERAANQKGDGRAALASVASASKQRQPQPSAEERVRDMRRAALEKLGKKRRSGRRRREAKPVEKSTAAKAPPSPPADSGETKEKYPSRHRYKF